MSFILMLSGVLEAYRHRAVKIERKPNSCSKSEGRHVNKFHRVSRLIIMTGGWRLPFLARGANHCVGTLRVSVTVVQVGEPPAVN